MEPGDKASAFVDCFAAKNRLIGKELNEYSRIQILQDDIEDAAAPGVDQVQKALERLDIDSATGPDKLPARILKVCATELAHPVHQLVLAILRCGRWPRAWMQHWICPIYKKKAPCDRKNYRGVHLTAQLSKVVERVLQVMWVPNLVQIGAFGENQFAYLPGRGSRDALALVVLNWISAFSRGQRVAVYCSDVSGAFDKVQKARLIMKLQASGIGQGIRRVIESWLGDREAHVVVEGHHSKLMPLSDMVYQGTVWGPPLWNLHYADARFAVRQNGFHELVFADDLNAFKSFEKEVTDEDMHDKMDECQRNVHAWGRANQVEFDPGKESKHILATAGRGSGGSFKLLGVTFDPGLTMEGGIQDIVRSASWKLATVVRINRCFTEHEMMGLYKSKVLSFIECKTAAIYHACDSHLALIDAIQKRFLKHLELSEEVALMSHNLAPLSTRRDIAMLGLVHRAVLREGPAQFFDLFRPSSRQPARFDTRAAARRHSRQLEDFRGRHFLELERRSAFGLVGVICCLLLWSNLLQCLGSRISCKTFKGAGVCR